MRFRPHPREERENVVDSDSSRSTFNLEVENSFNGDRQPNAIESREYEVDRDTMYGGHSRRRRARN